MTSTATHHRSSELDDLVLHLKGLVLVRNLRRRNGADARELSLYSTEIDRTRDRLAQYVRHEQQLLGA